MCPPSHIHQALYFNNMMREATGDLAGCPFSDWAWQKASLPSSLGDLKTCTCTRRALLHAPVAFIGSLSQSQALILQILGHLPAPLIHLSTTIPALAEAAGKSDWSSIDVHLHQKTLPGSINQASFLMFIDSAPNSHFKALALSSAI